MARDEFSAQTKRILAKRVGYRCSSPSCKVLTVGPHTDPEKIVSIGEAGHITAAAFGGPRYDETMTLAQRKHINNAIWVCASCHLEIDQEDSVYTAVILKDWKEKAEAEADAERKGNSNSARNFPIMVEADLLMQSKMRVPKGFSPRNSDPIQLGTGTPIYQYWDLIWNFDLVLYNNSSIPIFDIQIESIGSKHFRTISKLDRINNLKALGNINLEASCIKKIEATHLEADNILSEDIPKVLNGVELKVTYCEENGRAHTVLIKIENGEITSLPVIP